MADSTSDDPGSSGRPVGAQAAAGPDAELNAALDDTVVRAVLGSLRSGPRTVGELAGATGHGAPSVQTALHSLTEQGVVTADAPRVPGAVAYRIDGAALTGIRGLGRWFRARSPARPEPVRAGGEGSTSVPTADGSDTDDLRRGDGADAGRDGDFESNATSGPAGAHAAGAGSAAVRAGDDRRPSVAAWTNPAVRAALRRLEEQQRRSR